MTDEELRERVARLRGWKCRTKTYPEGGEYVQWAEPKAGHMFDVDYLPLLDGNTAMALIALVLEKGMEFHFEQSVHGPWKTAHVNNLGECFPVVNNDYERTAIEACVLALEKSDG